MPPCEHLSSDVTVNADEWRCTMCGGAHIFVDDPDAQGRVQQMRQVTVVPAPDETVRSWRFQFDDIPVSTNHQYIPLPNGRKALTQKARDCRKLIEMLTLTSGFKFDKTKCYSLTVMLTVPTWNSDVDGRNKILQDSIFGSRGDHRVVHIDIKKVVRKGTRFTDVLIEECEEL